MNIDEIVRELVNIQNRKNMRIPSRLRLYFGEIKLKNRAVLITGSRGVGKTTFMLSKIANQRVFYASADNPLVSSTDLWTLANAAFMKGYEGIAIDEVHYAKDWSIHLKAIFDSFPDKMILASDSSSLVLRSGTADLSRRFSRVNIPLLSLREFMHLKDGTELPIIDPLAGIDSSDVKRVLDTANVLAEFEDYLRRGFRPSYLVWDHGEQIEYIVEKTLHGDVPFFVSQISKTHFRLMRAIMGLLSASKVPTINVESMCRDWGVGKQKLYELLDVMSGTGLIRVVYRENDRKAFSKGAKILLADPSFYSLSGGNIGTQREAFVVQSFADSGKRVFACNDERNCDFVVDGVSIEVGGKNKRRKEADFVVRDDIDIPHSENLPLWVLGFQY